MYDLIMATKVFCTLPHFHQFSIFPGSQEAIFLSEIRRN
jgi:hypothetical protein